MFIGHIPPNSPMISGSFAEMACNFRHPMGVCHPVVSTRTQNTCAIYMLAHKMLEIYMHAHSV